jgi:hypothetical protein
MEEFDSTQSRRSFLKISAAGTAGMFIGGVSRKAALAAQHKSAQNDVWVDGMQINPNIDNMRHVFCYDAEMVTGNPSDWSPQAQNALVNAERVKENMDKMAIALAGLEVEDPADIAANAAAAWETIIQKPEGKEWSEVGVGLRPNALDERWAIVEKVVDVLNTFGVQNSNIVIFDGGKPSQDKVAAVYNDANLPNDIRFENIPGGEGECEMIDRDLTVAMCPNDILNGNIDILINLPVNKGHDRPLGGNYTMAFKNHIGTIKGFHEMDWGDGAIPATLIALNKTKELLGEPPVLRSQLHIIDSLWGKMAGPMGTPDRQTSCLAMGTFPPILDYLVVRKIREAQREQDGGPPWGMGVTDTHDDAMYEYLSAFGYDPQSDEIQNLDFINALEYEPTVGVKNRNVKQRYISDNKVTVTVSVPGNPYQAAFLLSRPNERIWLGIYDMQGGLLRSLSFGADSRKVIPVTWDRTNENGAVAPSGTYVVRLNAGKMAMTRKLVIAG